jgi:DNA-binding response OmpR family regulator
MDSSLACSGSALREAMRRRSLEWPVAVLCAGVNKAAQHEAWELGADLMLTRPFDADGHFDTTAWVIDEST